MNPAYLAAFLLGLKISGCIQYGLLILITLFPIQARPVIESQVCSFHLNIGKNWLNIAFTM